MNLEFLKVSLSIKNRIMENIDIIKMFNENNLKEDLESITELNFKDYKDFFKYRILNFIKSTKIIKNIIENDNKKFINIISVINDLSVRDKILESIIKDNNSFENCIKLDSINEFNIIYNSKKEYLSIINPFSELKVDTIIYENKEKYLTSNILINNSKINERDFNKAFRVKINKDKLKNDKFNLFNEEKSKEIDFAFTLFHELAHAGYSQIIPSDNINLNKKEKIADMSSIILLIKLNDFNIFESDKLCDFILNKRFSTANYNKKNLSGYMGGFSSTRDHFTEELIINLKNTLKDESMFEYIKKLNNLEISTFSEIFVDSSLSLINYEFQNYNRENKEILIDTILNDHNYIKELKNNYNYSYAIEFSRYSTMKTVDIIKKHPAPEEYIKKVNKLIKSVCINNDEAFKDLVINHQLKTNYENFMKKINETKINIEFINNLKFVFNKYRENKNLIEISIDNKTSSKELRNKIKQ